MDLQNAFQSCKADWAPHSVGGLSRRISAMGDRTTISTGGSPHSPKIGGNHLDVTQLLELMEAGSGIAAAAAGAAIG